LKIDIGTAQTIIAYQITAQSVLTELPKDWTLQGSNDDTNYTIIDTVVGETGWITGCKRIYTVDNPGSYRYYRINITANNGHATCEGFARLNLYR
jgi:hypothetical protein